MIIMEEEFKTVARFKDAMSAHILAGMLNENGIPAGVFGDNSSYVFLNYSDEVLVKVNAADEEAALKLIEENYPEE